MLEQITLILNGLTILFLIISLILILIYSRTELSAPWKVVLRMLSISLMFIILFSLTSFGLGLTNQFGISLSILNYLDISSKLVLALLAGILYLITILFSRKEIA